MLLSVACTKSPKAGRFQQFQSAEGDTMRRDTTDGTECVIAFEHPLGAEFQPNGDSVSRLGYLVREQQRCEVQDDPQRLEDVKRKAAEAIDEYMAQPAKKP